MSAAGPELPPHLLAKRKRQQEEEEASTYTTAPGAKRQKSPPMEAPARQVGPTPPPAPLDERPSKPPNDEDTSDDSDDDGFGPSLPGQGDVKYNHPQTAAEPHRAEADTTKSKSTARDEWMMVPPKQDDLSARLDPTKPRARGFNTGKSAQAPGGAISDEWTETPEQKRQRLANQVMGVKAPSSELARPVKADRGKQDEDQGKAARIKESRGKSLYDMHQKRSDKEEEDDPSQRAFDREKDIAKVKIGGKQRQEMLNKAAGFGSKFSSGSYL